MDPSELDAAWERIKADCEGPIQWVGTTTGYSLLKDAVRRELAAARREGMIEAAGIVSEAANVWGGIGVLTSRQALNRLADELCERAAADAPGGE